MPLLVLDQSCVRALVGQGKATRIAQHMRVGGQGQADGLAIFADRRPGRFMVYGRAPLAYDKGPGLRALILPARPTRPW